MMPAYLLIDCGNTRIKWALLDDLSIAPSDLLGKITEKTGLGHAWRAYGARPHAEFEQLQADWRNLPELQQVIIANVAGPHVREQILEKLQAVCRQLPKIEWFASSLQRAGVHNGYHQPSQLGCDRFAAVIGAHAMLPGKNILVANCGTATTLDGITASGQFIGGMILPGLALMAQSLARNTAQLPQVQHAAQLPHTFADNTDDAIISGCINAQAGAIEKTVRELEHRLAQPVHCLLSGGAAFAIAPGLSILHQLLDNLVLLGLHAVLRAEQASNA